MVEKTEGLYFFVSYSRSDKALVTPIRTSLENKGIILWIDEAIVPGLNWDDELQNRIKNSIGVIAFLSKDFFGSVNCLREIQFAHEVGIKVYPILLKPIEAKVLDIHLQQFQLSEIQYANFSTPEISEKYMQQLRALASKLLEEVKSNQSLVRRLFQSHKFRWLTVVALVCILFSGILVITNPPLEPFKAQFGILITYFNTKNVAHLSKEVNDVVISTAKTIEKTVAENWKGSGYADVYTPEESHIYSSATNNESVEEARELATKYNAAVVIYGYASEVDGQIQITPMIYINPQHMTFAPELSGHVSLPTTPVQVNDAASTVPFISTINDYVRYFTQIYSGLSEFYAGHYATANGAFQSIIANKIPDGAQFKTPFIHLLIGMAYMASVDINALGECNLTLIESDLKEAQKQLEDAKEMSPNRENYRANSGLGVLYIRKAHLVGPRVKSCYDDQYRLIDLGYARTYINEALKSDDFAEAPYVGKVRLLLNSARVEYFYCRSIEIALRPLNENCQDGEKSVQKAFDLYSDQQNSVQFPPEGETIFYWQARYLALVHQNYSDALKLIEVGALDNHGGTSTYIPGNEDFLIWLLFEKADLEYCQGQTVPAQVTMADALKVASKNQFAGWQTRISSFLSDLNSGLKVCEYERQYE